MFETTNQLFNFYDSPSSELWVRQFVETPAGVFRWGNVFPRMRQGFPQEFPLQKKYGTFNYTNYSQSNLMIDAMKNTPIPSDCICWLTGIPVVGYNNRQ